MISDTDLLSVREDPQEFEAGDPRKTADFLKICLFFPVNNQPFGEPKGISSIFCWSSNKSRTVLIFENGNSSKQYTNLLRIFF
jgi:hypothetical protein